MIDEKNRLKDFSHGLDFGYLLGGKFPVLGQASSSVSGQGIVAHEDIAVHTVVCPLYGILYNMEKAVIDYPKYSYQISDTIAIETTNEPGFFNHSCDPNVYINVDWMFESIRDIKKGEEILIDYSTVDYFDYGFECKCGSLNCRKNFNGLDSGNSDYQRIMGKYFSPYLKTKFSIN